VTSSRGISTSLSFRFWRGKHLGKSKCRHFATSSSVLRTIGEHKTLSLAEEIRQYEPIVYPERFLLALPPSVVHCCGHSECVIVDLPKWAVEFKRFLIAIDNAVPPNSTCT
jgi:hypothetical protein